VRIGVFSAHPAAMAAAGDAFARIWPEARLHHLLDDAVFDAVRQGRSHDAAICDLLAGHGHYLQACGAAALLYTCSAFHDCLHGLGAGFPIPLVGPNDAMIDAALGMGSRLALLATVPDTLPSLRVEIRNRMRPQAEPVQIDGYFVEHAFDQLAAGRPAEHDRLVAEAAARIGNADVVLLGQFSLARARPAVAARVSVPVLAAPDAAVEALRIRLLGPAADATDCVMPPRPAD